MAKHLPSFADQYPALALEWHPTKNGHLCPTKVTPKSHKKVWWLCKKDPNHEWFAMVQKRAEGRGCPYCSGNKPSKTTNLMVLFPAIASEWHPIKNGDLKPADVSPKSNKKVWWRCSKDLSHSDWLARIADRTDGTGCARCSDKKLSEQIRTTKEKSLATILPTLAAEWHPTKNGGLKPTDVLPRSGKKVWWKCSRNPEHEWIARVAERTRGRGCRYCTSKTSQNELRIYAEFKCVFPDAESRMMIGGVELDVWLPNLRIGIEYDGVYWHRSKSDRDKKKSDKLTSQGIHLIRVREKGLPRTSLLDLVDVSPDREISLPQIKALLRKIETICPLPDAASSYLSRESFLGDSLYKKLLADMPGPMPGKSLMDINPGLAREWHPTKNCSLTPMHVSTGSGKAVWWLCPKDSSHEWRATVNDRKSRGCPFCAGKRPTRNNNLKVCFPAIAAEWHPTKNLPLNPNDITPKSSRKVWWRCGSDSTHNDWLARVVTRTYGSGCPQCAKEQASMRIRATKEKNIATLFPRLAAEWHPIRNGDLTPYDLLPGSNTKVWWRCSKENNHEWLSAPKSRIRGGGCPLCWSERRGKQSRATPEKNLAVCFPNIASEWHPTKNNPVKPMDVSPKSNKKVWWLCRTNASHMWYSSISNRANGSGCPHCWKKRKTHA